tara:strand:- start:9331 stop:9750 length:420 start_codon:yes stop_codon:yes gene_type:complete
MKTLLALPLSLFLALTPAVVHAETPACKDPVAVTSPCSGVLLPTSAATEGLQCLKIKLPKLKLDLEYQERLWESREKRYKSLLTIEQKRGDSLFQQLQGISTVQKTAWYETNEFYFALGFVVATVATIGIVYAVHPSTE